MSQQVVTLAEANSELTMARVSEKSSLEKLMEMMVSIRLEDKRRDEEREQHMREIDDRLERNRAEREIKGRKSIWRGRNHSEGTPALYSTEGDNN